MNAAARLVHQSTLSRHLILTYLLTRRQFVILALMFTILASALGIIYVTHVSRILHASYQHYLAERDRLHIERGQLLLERGTFMVQSRIQDIAQNKLNMVMPDHQSVVIIHE